ncbi:hypothetical protein ACHAXH_006449 [Discostella pseudostelligera]
MQETRGFRVADDEIKMVMHGNENATSSSTSELGCQLELNVSSSTLRSSINELLSEISKMALIQTMHAY